jgi:ryanodine receptor 2
MFLFPRKARDEETTNSANNALVTSTSSLTTSSASQTTEKRFAYSLLEKLLEYVERASSTMQNYKESTKFSLHESYRLSTKDVKFFGKVNLMFNNEYNRIGNVLSIIKVVLPLVERYFQAHREYFITPSSLKTGSGYATVKEKEMSCRYERMISFLSNPCARLVFNSLFCKLAFLLRQKFSAFGNEVNISVRCLKVLVRAIDVR